MPAYNFKQQFAEPIRSRQKRQTIRASGKRKPPKVGDTLYLYTGMRTAECRKLGEFRCNGVWHITIETEHRRVRLPRMIGATLTMWDLDQADVDALAKADGFESTDAFFDWFRENHGKSMSGYLIGWE